MEKRSYKRLTIIERRKIKELKEQRYSIRKIANALGFSSGTIHYELHKGDATGSGQYDPDYAELQSKRNQQEKGREPILSSNPDFAKYIADLILYEKKSPEQICAALRINNPFNVAVSINTIYRAIDENLLPGITRESLCSHETRMFSNGMICIPKWIRNSFQFQDGDVFYIDSSDDGTITLKKKNL